MQVHWLLHGFCMPHNCLLPAMSASTTVIVPVEADMAGSGQLCGVQNPCRSQCTCTKFCWRSNCLLHCGRICWEFIILLYIEFYAAKLNSARILRAAELSPSSSIWLLYNLIVIAWVNTQCGPVREGRFLRITHGIPMHASPHIIVPRF